MKGKINIQQIPANRLEKGRPAYFREQGYLYRKIKDIQGDQLIFSSKVQLPADEASEFIFTHEDKIYPLSYSQWLECLDNDWYERESELEFKINKDGFSEVVIEPVAIGVKQRGFSLGKFTDDYGQLCSIQMSSIATRRCIWLGIDNTGPHLEGPTKKRNEDINARMHLTREDVKRILPLLKKFANTGDLD